MPFAVGRDLAEPVRFITQINLYQLNLHSLFHECLRLRWANGQTLALNNSISAIKTPCIPV